MDFMSDYIHSFLLWIVDILFDLNTDLEKKQKANWVLFSLIVLSITYAIYNFKKNGVSAIGNKFFISFGVFIFALLNAAFNTVDFTFK
ncbi:hypothetical protein [Sulfurimonas sp. HSL3-7]|uniref:hypothetical protein n=1 Tax=Sulfonitrofixus jiaomeiensis TaxID=3131938 RepID=UPI0031F7AE14